MGQPVEDQQHHKGLGIILSSTRNEDAEKLKQTSSSEDQTKDKAENSKPDLPASVQNSPNSFSSNRDYSYTEALFTGTPLFNGRPFTTFDKPQSVQDHASGIRQPAKENEGNLERYNSAGLVDPVVEHSDDRNKHNESAQRQKETHSEEGVTGVVINTTLQEGENHEVFQTVEHENEEKNSLNETPENAMELVKNQYFIPLGGSLNKSSGEVLKTVNNQDNQQPYKSGPLDTDALQQPNLPTRDNRTPNVQGPSHSGHNGGYVENQLPYKNYDEESNVLGSNGFGHATLVHQHAGHTMDMEYQKIRNMESEEKTNEGLYPNGIVINAKETNSVSQAKSDKTLSKEGKEEQTSPYQSLRNKQTDGLSNAPNKLPDSENQEQQEKQGLIYEAKQTADGNLNDTKTTSMASTTLSHETDHGVESGINQLRPHKIIESTFDEELAHRISPGLSYPQKPPKGRPYPDAYDFEPLSTYREGSNPLDFIRENETATNGRQETPIQGSLHVSETTSLGPLSAMQKETKTKQVTSGHEIGYTGTSQESVEKEKETHYESSDSFIRPPSGQGETGPRVSSSHHVESNPSEFSSRKNYELFKPKDKSEQVESPNTVTISSSPSRENKEETTQNEEVYQSSENTFHGGPVQEGTVFINKGLTQESKDQGVNQKQTYKEIPPASSNRETESSSILSPQQEEPAVNGQNGNSLDASSVGSDAAQTVPLNNYENRASTQKKTPYENGVNTMSVDTVYPHYDKPVANSNLRGTETNFSPSDVPLRPSDPSLSEHEGQHAFRVGVPEQAEEMATEFQIKGGDKHYHQTEASNGGDAEGKRNDQLLEKDRDNKNQKIVYFLKMAKGIPLLNNRPIHDQHREFKETLDSGSHPTGKIKEKENKYASGGEIGYQAIPRRYRWRWKPRPSYSKPKPRPSPYPSPYPSPVTSTTSGGGGGGGGGGALGGSSVDSNVPQGMHFQSFILLLLSI